MRAELFSNLAGIVAAWLLAAALLFIRPGAPNGTPEGGPPPSVTIELAQDDPPPKDPDPPKPDEMLQDDGEKAKPQETPVVAEKELNAFKALLTQGAKYPRLPRGVTGTPHGRVALLITLKEQKFVSIEIVKSSGFPFLDADARFHVLNCDACRKTFADGIYSVQMQY